MNDLMNPANPNNYNNPLSPVSPLNPANPASPYNPANPFNESNPASPYYKSNASQESKPVTSAPSKPQQVHYQHTIDSTDVDVFVAIALLSGALIALVSVVLHGMIAPRSLSSRSGQGGIDYGYAKARLQQLKADRPDLNQGFLDDVIEIMDRKKEG